MNVKALKRSFVLEPYVGADDIRFGMKRSEVSVRLGPPDVVDVSALGECNEHRSALRVAFDATDETVVELGFTPACDVVLRGVSLFSIDDPLEFLMSIDAHPQLLFGFLVFEGLGLTITGYHDGDVGQRAICLFMRERFRPFSADMTPYVP